jgi:hypothetical protein
MNNLLQNYSPNLLTYQYLWEKFAPKSTVEKLAGLIASQEEAVKWSLKLKELFKIEADKQEQEASHALEAFVEGVKDSREGNKLHAGLAKIGNPKELVEQYGLHFILEDLEDLFLSDETEISSVMNNV